MATTTKTIADPSVCTRCAGGDHVPGRGEAICILCVLAEADDGGEVAA